MPKLQEIAGFGTAESCRVSVGKIVRKATAGSPATAEEDSDKEASPESTKKKGGGRKRKAGRCSAVSLYIYPLHPLTFHVDTSDGDEDGESPIKKKASPRKGKKGGKSEAESVENETEVKKEAQAEDADDDF